MQDSRVNIYVSVCNKHLANSISTHQEQRFGCPAGLAATRHLSGGIDKLYVSARTSLIEKSMREKEEMVVTNLLIQLFPCEQEIQMTSIAHFLAELTLLSV